MPLKRKNRLVFLIIGIIFLITSIIMLIYNINYSNIIEKKEQQNINSFLDETSKQEKKLILSEEKVSTKEEAIKNINSDYNYIAVLEIPNIKLKRGLVDYNNKYNDVKYNIQMIESSNMPNVINGNLILASHNGTSNVSFFRDLNKLPLSSLINVYYKGNKYIYRYNNNYEVDKDGKIEIIRDLNKTTITLITCKENSKTKQVVYIGYLVDKVEY